MMLADALANLFPERGLPKHLPIFLRLWGRNKQRQHFRHAPAIFLGQLGQKPTGHVTQYALISSQSNTNQIIHQDLVYSAAAFTSPTAPEAIISFISSVEKPSTSERISAVCSPSNGDRITSAGLADSLIGHPTEIYSPRSG